MAITRITVRTFQNEQHAELFIMFGKNLLEKSIQSQFKINMSIIQNQENKNQVTSIWTYDDEKHLKEVRSFLSKHSSMPNSLAPREIVYSGEVVMSSKE